MQDKHIDELQEFLKTLKIHNKDLDACFNDAMAVHHLLELVDTHINKEKAKAELDSKLKKAIDMSGNEFAMGYNDSGCFWHFQYGNRGAGNMIQGCGEVFNSESAEVSEALDEFIAQLTKDKEDGSE